MIKPGEARLSKLFEPVQWGRFQIKNRIKYGACCVSELQYARRVHNAA
jgi:2,4-dienoyl-CoA reductase (NADPH2)